MAKPARKSAVSFKNRLESTFKTMSSEMVRVGFSDIDKWVGMGNYAMNRMNSGRFKTAWLFGRNYVLYGESGSGKSLMAAMIAARAQKEHNALVVWVDLEHATDDKAGQAWLRRAGLDLDNVIYVSLASLADLKKLIAESAMDVRKNYLGDGKEEIQPVVVVVDSWAAAQTDAQMERTEKGELVGDMGQKAKQTGDVILSTTHLSSGIPYMVIGIQHVMDNQDTNTNKWMKHKTTGGNKMVYFASGCMLYTKKPLRMEDVEDPEQLAKLRETFADWSQNLKKDVGIGKDGNIVGVTIVVENLKSRYAKPFQRIEVQVPYKFGMDPYSGLFELLLLEQAIWPTGGAWFAYRDDEKGKLDEETKLKVVKFQRSEFRAHADRIMDLQPEDLSAESNDEPSEPMETSTEDSITLESEDMKVEANFDASGEVETMTVTTKKNKKKAAA